MAERVSAALPAEYDLLHATDAQQARRLLAAHPEPALLLVGAPAMADLAPLKAEYPHLHAVLLTPDRALARAVRALPMSQLQGVLAQGLPAARLRAELTAALEAARADRARTRYPSDFAAGVSALHDTPSPPVWPRSPEAIELRRDWLRVLAHDLRTPLDISNAYATLLLEGDEPLAPGVRDLLQRIRSNGEWMTGFVNGVLDLADLEQGFGVLRPVPTRLDELVQGVVERMRGLTEARQMRIVATIPPDRSTYRIDCVRVEQVLHNLVSNAVHMSEAGTAIHLSAGQEGEWLVFEVRDEGRGMAPEEVARAFEMLASSSGGRGLGLSIARAIVELHGGQITCESAPERGTTFRFTIRPIAAD